jgi:hypothetical protein
LIKLLLRLIKRLVGESQKNLNLNKIKRRLQSRVLLTFSIESRNLQEKIRRKKVNQIIKLKTQSRTEGKTQILHGRMTTEGTKINMIEEIVGQILGDLMMTSIINPVVGDKVEMITFTLIHCNREVGVVGDSTMIQMLTNLEITQEAIKTLEETIQMSSASHKEIIKGKSDVGTTDTRKKKRKVTQYVDLLVVDTVPKIGIPQTKILVKRK